MNIVKGMPQLLARMDAIKPNIKFMERLALSAVREQKLQTVRFRKTGNLGRSIRIGAVTPTRAETIAGANYAAYVERGTRAHDIKPKTKKVLAWAADGSARLSGAVRKGGNVRFAKRVRHPGTRAQPYMIPGAKKAVESAGLKTIVVTAWNSAA